MTNLCLSICPLSQLPCETLEQSSIHINVSTQTSHQRHLNVPCITAVHGLMTDGTNFIKYSTGKAEP